MASNQPVPPKGAPLGMMKRLSPDVYLYEPASDAQARPVDAEAPKFIVVFAWYAAQDAHIAKYITQHLALYPTARILLVMCPFLHMLPYTSHKIQPAVDALGAFVDTLPAGGNQASELLMHSFSNGGGFNLTRLAELWEKKTGGPLPPHVTVVDSAPDKFTLARAVNTLTVTTPWYIRPFAMAGVVVMITVLGYGLQFPTVPDVAFVGINSTGVLANEARRTYIYSKEDPVVGYKDIELNVEEAERMAAKLGSGGKSLVVRREVFVGSGHVAHSRNDSERYWRVVRQTVEGELSTK